MDKNGIDKGFKSGYEFIYYYILYQIQVGEKKVPLSAIVSPNSESALYRNITNDL